MSDTTAPVVTTAPAQPDAGWLEASELVEHRAHWWREPVAGFIAVGISTYDAWFFDRDAGLSSSLDEILLLTGIALIAGIRNLFGATTLQKPPGSPPEAPKGAGGIVPP